MEKVPDKRAGGKLGVLATFVVAVAVCATFALAGCSSAKSYTFDVENGVSMKVQLDTSTGYDLSEDNGNFYITKDGNTVATGFFIVEEGWDYYTNAIDTGIDDGSVVINSDTRSSGENEVEISFQVNNPDGTVEYNHIVYFQDIKTGAAIGCVTSQAEADEVYGLLTIFVDQ
ncbi:MAG: hypothetical protein ACOYIK_02830 [Coriobacteriales bacterium]